MLAAAQFSHARRFITSSKSIGLSLFKSQRKFTEQFGCTPYLMDGHLYTQIANPNIQDRQGVIPKIKAAIESVKRVPEATKKQPRCIFFNRNSTY
jgi:hypothetical protein